MPANKDFKITVSNVLKKTGKNGQNTKAKMKYLNRYEE